MSATPTKQAFYIFSHGTLKRKDNTVFFIPSDSQAERTIETHPEGDRSADLEIRLDVETEELPNHPGRKAIPIESIDGFYVFGEVGFNSRFLQFLSAHRIPLHLFNYYGFYSGSYYPREYLLSGHVLVQQVSHYTNADQRLSLARRFVEAAAFNILKTLKYHAAESRQPSSVRQDELNGAIDDITEAQRTLPAAGDIETLMGLEGNIRKRYYAAWPSLLKTTESAFTFDGRKKNPPDNAVNALISFGNALCYSACLNELYRTQLNPTIAYLHQPGDRRFSLALDLAEIFKPILVDRTIIKLINTKQIQPNHFTKGLNFCHLNDAGRRIFVKEFEEKLRTTIEHRTLERSVSYRRLIRLECYKLIKQLLGEVTYEPFKIWW